MSDRRVRVWQGRRWTAGWLLSSLMLLGIAMPWSATAADCPYENHLVLGASESIIDATVRAYACQTLTLESGFVVGPTGVADLAAGGAIRLRPGVRVQAGGRLQARSGAVVPPPALAVTPVPGDVCSQYGMCGLEFTVSEGLGTGDVMLSVLWGDDATLAEMTLQQCVNAGICSSLGDGRYRIWHSYLVGNFSGTLRWSETPTGLQGVVPFSVAVAQIQDLVLQAQPGNRSVILNWTDLPADQYNLCRSETQMSHIDNCYVVGGEPIELDIGRPPHTVSELITWQDYYFRLEGRFGDQSILSNEAMGRPRRLNDTGIDWCADAVNNYDNNGTAAYKEQQCVAVTNAGYPRQDGHYGRDVAARAGTLTKVGGGRAGFDYTKIANNGAELAESATLGSDPTDWACTRDNVTGLIWEVKVDNPSHLRHRGHTYTWYDPTSPNGTQDGGFCDGSSCDTTGFVQAVNAQSLCGSSDWRMPTRKELQGIVHYGRTNTKIDLVYFRLSWLNGFDSNFWSGSPNLATNDLRGAWNVNFLDGVVETEPGTTKYRVRLVRGAE